MKELAANHKDQIGWPVPSLEKRPDDYSGQQWWIAQRQTQTRRMVRRKRTSKQAFQPTRPGLFLSHAFGTSHTHLKDTTAPVRFKQTLDIVSTTSQRASSTKGSLESLKVRDEERCFFPAAWLENVPSTLTSSQSRPHFLGISPLPSTCSRQQ